MVWIFCDGNLCERRKRFDKSSYTSHELLGLFCVLKMNVRKYLMQPIFLRLLPWIIYVYSYPLCTVLHLWLSDRDTVVYVEYWSKKTIFKQQSPKRVPLFCALFPSYLWHLVKGHIFSFAVLSVKSLLVLSFDPVTIWGVCLLVCLFGVNPGSYVCVWG